MTYVKNTWVDQQGQVRYTETEDGGYKIFTANYEEVTQLGTPVNADNMNHIEDGIADCFDYVDTEVASAKDYALNLLKAIYPVGSLYVGTTTSCPLANLFGTWSLVSAGKALWTGNGTNANTTIAAGLPNITGNFRLGDDADSNYWARCWEASGAFSGTSQSHIFGNYDDGSTKTAIGNVTFDASRSSTIYGKSSTVQPPAYVVNVWRRVA